MTWSHEDDKEGDKEGAGAGEQTEEAAMSAALTRAFRAVDEEVVGSVSPLTLGLLVPQFV